MAIIWLPKLISYQYNACDQFITKLIVYFEIKNMALRTNYLKSSQFLKIIYPYLNALHNFITMYFENKGQHIMSFLFSPLKHILWLFICNCNKDYAFITSHRSVFFSLDFRVQKYLKLGTFCVILALIAYPNRKRTGPGTTLHS